MSMSAASFSKGRPGEVGVEQLRQSYIIIIIIIITHTKIGAQKKSISMTIWTSSQLDFFPSPTVGLRVPGPTTGPLLP